MRRCGIFLHITSLPSPYGIGTLGRDAYDFVDFLHKCGQTVWQILPLGHIGSETYYSPYMPYSAFAGNPLLIDIDLLINEGLIEKDDLNGVNWGNKKHVEYQKVETTRRILFSKAFQRSDKIIKSYEFEDFKRQNSYWLNDYSEFMAKRNPDSQIVYYEFVQYLFFKQWYALKRYANKKNIKIFGDIPMYVSADSADLRYHSELFLLDDRKRPALVAGVPPDTFSKRGQKWGNPLYDWAELKKTGYQWWICRIKQASVLYDLIKLDHFRGFEEFYAVPADASNAEKGEWLPGPKEEFFKFLNNEIPKVNFVAEDLGLIGKDVKRLLNSTGFSGMKILQFAFNTDSNNPYLPHNYIKNSVVYTGTHDNNTTKGWLDSVNRNEFDFAVQYLRLNTYEKYTEGMIRAALGSVADTAIIPLVDWLDFGEDARMNTPGTTKNNWMFRISKDDITSQDLSRKILFLTKLYGR